MEKSRHWESFAPLDGSAQRRLTWIGWDLMYVTLNTKDLTQKKKKITDRKQIQKHLFLQFL